MVFCFGSVIGVFCHPYWFTSLRYDVGRELTGHILATQPFDVLELLGGYRRCEVDSNTLMVARYHEERAKGRRIPIVGVSDAHDLHAGELFGWYYTVAFSPSCAYHDLAAGLREGFSVAVEATTPIPAGGPATAPA